MTTINPYATSVARQLHSHQDDHAKEPEFHSTKTTPHGKNSSLHYLDRSLRSRNSGGARHKGGKAVLAFDAHHSRPTEQLHGGSDGDTILAYMKGHSGHHKGRMNSSREINMTGQHESGMYSTVDTEQPLEDAQHPIHSAPAHLIHNASRFAHTGKNYQTTAGESRDFVVENQGRPSNAGITTSHSTTGTGPTTKAS